MRPFLCAVALCLAGPVCAADTSFGEVDIQPLNEMEQGLRVGDTVTPLPTDPHIAFIEEQVGDWLLVSLSQGGNACGAEYVWAMPGEDGVIFSPVFGTCYGDYEIETLDDGAVRVTIPNSQVGAGPVAYVFDGTRLTAEREGLEPVGWTMGDPGTFWEGKYLFDLLDAAELQAPLTALLDAQELHLVQKNAGLGTPMEPEGDWIVGSACEKALCETNRTAIAVSRDGSRLVVALAEDGRDPQVFGADGTPMPSVITQVSGPAQPH